jgi:hypothetical protein
VQRSALRGPSVGHTVETAAPEGCRRLAPSRKVERSKASNTLTRGRDEALAPWTRQPAQVLQYGSPQGAAPHTANARAA